MKKAALIFLFVFAVVCGLWTVDCFCEEKGLMAYWKLDEGKGDIAKDASGSGNEASVGVEWAKGKFGTCLYYSGDGAAYCTVADNDKIHFGTGDFSIECWIAPSTFDTDSGDKRVRFFSKNAYPQTWLCVNFTGDGNIQMEMADENAKWGGSTSIGTAKANAWNHIVIVNDRKKKKTNYYINGKLDCAQDIAAEFTGDMSVPEKDFVLGSEWQPFAGLLDEVKLWSRALTADEVKAAYDKEKANRADAKYETED